MRYCVVHNVPMVIAFVLLFAWGLAEQGWVMAVLASLYLPTYYLRWSGRWDAMRHWLSACSILDVIVFDLYMGPEGNARLLLLAQVMMPYCIFSDDEQKWRTFWAVMPAVSFMALLWGNTVTPVFEPQLAGTTAIWFSIVPASVATIDLVMRVRLYSERSAKSRESLQKASKAALRASAAKSEFLANMSHEIRTPLNGIMGLTDLLRQSELKLEQREYLATISHSADALLLIISDILDFSNIEAGQLKLHPGKFSLSQVLEDVADLFAPQIQERDIEFVVSRGASIPPALIGDAGRVRKILLNLVSNAVKFTAKGVISIRAGCEEADDGRQSCWVEVSDTGSGIAAEDQTKLFGSFSQVDGSSTRKYGGTGLGLAICKRLTSMMDGEVSVVSEVGRGSTFRFRVVLDEVEDTQPVLTSCVSPPGKLMIVHSGDATADNIVERCRTELELEVVRAGTETLTDSTLATSATVFAEFDLVHAVALQLLAKAQCQRLIIVSTHPELIRARGLAKQLGARVLVVPPAVQALREVVTGAATEVLPKPVLALAGRGMRVLVVDDNRINRMVCKKLLSKLGAEVDLAEDGVEAVEKSVEAIYDLILMDLQMPVMDGFDAASWIRERSCDVHVPIYALTANALPEDRKHALDVGMDEFLTKPIKLAKLQEVLAQLQRRVAMAA